MVENRILIEGLENMEEVEWIEINEPSGGCLSTNQNSEQSDALKEPNPVTPEFVILQVQNPSTSSDQMSAKESSFPSSSHSPTSSIPGIIRFKGQLNFESKFTPFSYKNWDFSTLLNKLYTDMNKWVQVKFSLNNYPVDGLYIRALPVYAEASDLKIPVRRCPHHADLDDPTNEGFAFPDHLIRFDNPSAMYCEDLESGRLSVVVPLGRPQTGTSSIPMMLKFMCLGSDIGGINRRPLKIVFTLEDEKTNVLGRQVFEVRICCCPKRDKANDEERYENSANRKKTEKNSLEDQILMIPVHKDDFKKLNEFAEAAWICREPSNEQNIKQLRRNHLRKVGFTFCYFFPRII